jgi:hypothetical protein
MRKIDTPEVRKQKKKDKASKIARLPRGRHTHLKKKLRQENVFELDLIWRSNFYVELIRDNQCHYCLGKLNPTGHALDRMDSSRNHEADNVVPCCLKCNRIKGEFWEYEHMMLLAPKLRFLQTGGELVPRRRVFD